MKWWDETGRDTAVLLTALRESYRPSTARFYADTLAHLLPGEFTKESVPWRILRVLHKEAGVLSTVRATPFTPRELTTILPKLPQDIRNITYFLWITACRHRDLCMADFARLSPTTVRLRWNVWKSDPQGKRAFHKFIFCPTEHQLAHPIPSLKQLNNHLKRCSGKTSYSLRRGAITALADMGFSFREIQEFTGHTPTADPHLAVRRYHDPSPNQPEGSAQLRMSKLLAQSLFPNN